MRFLYGIVFFLGALSVLIGLAGFSENILYSLIFIAIGALIIRFAHNRNS